MHRKGKTIFTPELLKTLTKNGISIIDITVIPDTNSATPFASGTRGYVVDDNGTNRILTYAGICGIPLKKD